MPTVSVLKKDLEAYLGREITFQELFDLCFEFGLEVELAKKGDDDSDEEEEQPQASQEEQKESQDIKYKIEVPANRYDLLCLQGIGQALKCFTEAKPEALPLARVSKTEPQNLKRIIVAPETAGVRPYIVGAILRNIDLQDESVYGSFMQLQQKLHHNIGKKRALVAIGTHDLDKMASKGDIHYKAEAPESISFIPLNMKEKHTAAQLMEIYKSHKTLKHFLHLLEDKPAYPIIYDEEGVLSLPPLINSDRTRISHETKNVFIECTATDLTKVNIVINTLVNMYSRHCSPAFEYERVEVVFSETDRRKYPNFETDKIRVESDYANRLMGLSGKGEVLQTSEMMKSLGRMGYKLIKEDQDNAFSVEYNSLRSDVLHPCDVVEDLAISYGYTKLPLKMPPSLTFGKQLPMSKLQKQLRSELAMLGFTECLTMALLSEKEQFDMMMDEENKENIARVVRIDNPKTKEFEIIRQSLLPCLLKVIKKNKSLKLPIQIFEISDVVFKDADAETGASNHRKLCVMTADKESKFDVINGVMDHVMKRIGLSFEKQGYWKELSEHPSFLKGQCNRIKVEGGLDAGIMGVLHPKVLKAYDLKVPVTCVELDMEILFQKFINN